MSTRSLYVCDGCGVEKDTIAARNLGWFLITNEPVDASADRRKRILHICADCWKGLPDWLKR